MESTKKNWSTALFISAFGLLVFGAIVTVGCFVVGYGLVVGVLVGCLVPTIGAVCNFYGVKAKRAISETGKWRMVELACVLIMLVMAIVAFKPMVIGFNYLCDSSALRNSAQADIASVDSLNVYFQETENARVDATYSGLIYFVSSGTRGASQDLRDFIAAEFPGVDPFELRQENINAHRSSLEANIQAQPSGLSVDRRSSLEETIENLPISAGMISEQISAYASSVSTDFNTCASQVNLPIISAGAESTYIATATTPKNFECVPSAYDKAYEKINTMSTPAIVVVVLVLFLSFFIYIISFRNSRVEIETGSKMSENLGLPL